MRALRIACACPFPDTDRLIDESSCGRVNLCLHDLARRCVSKIDSAIVVKEEGGIDALGLNQDRVRPAWPLYHQYR